MTSDDKNRDEMLPFSSSTEVVLVERSTVPADLQYGEYRQYLRHDFFYSCAYCTMSEAEARAIRFTIDHYEPRNARPDLVHEYNNLMYSCDECNKRKGDRCPPPNARADGYRFFRPDQDAYNNHFQLSGIRVGAKSHVGEYSIQALDLNRLALRRLREIRERLTNCDRLVAEGVRGLRKFHIDRLPPSIKGAAMRAIGQADNFANEIVKEIDSLLRNHARSELIDTDPESKSRAQERTNKLKEMQSLHAGSWRAPRKKRR